MKKKLITLISLGFILLASCSKYPPETSRLAEDMVIYTKYDLTANFATYKTFAIVPNIAYIDGKDSSVLTDANAQALLGEITLNMENRGYKLTSRTSAPDLGINVTAIKNTSTTVYTPGWYWGYPGYYSPGWWGYPGYGYDYPYPPTYISSYSTGTLLIDLVDLKNKTTDNKVMIRWNAYIRALMTGNHTLDDIIKSIDQAFKQTPAIKASAK